MAGQIQAGRYGNGTAKEERDTPAQHAKNRGRPNTRLHNTRKSPIHSWRIKSGHVHATRWRTHFLPPSVPKKHPRTRPNIAPHAVKAREPVNKQTVARCCCCSRALSRARHAAVVFHGGRGWWLSHHGIPARESMQANQKHSSVALIPTRLPSEPAFFSLRLPSCCPASSPRPSGRERTTLQTENRNVRRTFGS